MGEFVYMLCAMTSAGCAGLLARAYLKRRLRLLFWSCLCFLALAINNCLLYIDFLMVPNIDLSLMRAAFSLAGVSAMIYGLIWDTM